MPFTPTHMLAVVPIADAEPAVPGWRMAVSEIFEAA